jgi:hypothetical protein
VLELRRDELGATVGAAHPLAKVPLEDLELLTALLAREQVRRFGVGPAIGLGRGRLADAPGSGRDELRPAPGAA